MPSYRPYLRTADSPFSSDPVKWLMGIFASLWVVQLVWERWLVKGMAYYGWFGLSSDAVLHGRKVWTLLTYNFLQNVSSDTAGVFVLIFNLLGLYFFGGAVRELVGPRRFSWLYATFIAAGAAAWCAASVLGVDWMLLGPSVTIAGLFALYCCYHANEQITFLAFFIIPVTAKPKIFCWIWVALDLAGFLFFEMMGRPSPWWNGHLANLVAMATAYGYFRFAGRVDPFGGSSSSGIDLPRWLRRWKKAATPAPHFKVNLSNRDDLRAEVDRILDKINSQGFGALTADEKRLLDEARDLLSRH